MFMVCKKSVGGTASAYLGRALHNDQADGRSPDWKHESPPFSTAEPIGQRDSGASGREYKINLSPQCWDIQTPIRTDGVL
jgi:hypothetical protein